LKKNLGALLWVFFATLVGYGLVSWRNIRSNPPAPLPKNPASQTEQPQKNLDPARIFHASQKVMGSLADLTIVSSDEALVQQSFTDCFAEMTRLDALLTTWTETSDTSKLNAAAGKAPIKVSAETLEILQRALTFSQQTDGLFDVTVGAFSGLWKFDQDKDGSIPSKEAVQERLRLVGYQDLRVDSAAGTASLQREKMRVTLGGIGKGYAVDRCVAMFRQRGLQNFLVQAGGDLYVAGEKAPGSPWKVGIRDPRGKEEDTFASFSVRDRSFSTSGDYERFVLIDGVRYHHILDPRTGFPAEASMSATVSAKDATTAEGLSKAFFLWGPALTKQKIDAGVFGEIGAVVVSRSGEIYMTPALRDGTLGTEIFLRPPTIAP
jgi:FAD:protein FMN transferase